MSTVDALPAETAVVDLPVAVRPWWRRALPWAALAAGLVFGILLQSQLYPSQERLVTTVLMYVGLASAWNLVGGFTGYACFGQVGFFGLGAYTTALLMVHARWSFWLTLPIAAVIAGAFAALVGAPLLRLKGHYFAVATLGVAEGLREVIINLPQWTGGGGGTSIPALGDKAVTPWLGNDTFYIVFLLVAVGVVAVAIVVSTSRAGFALRAIHQDEDAAAAIGINTTVAKTLAFTVSAALTGAIGAVYAFQILAIYPNPVFDVEITVLMVVMVVIGGFGTVVGPIVGAVVIAFGSEYLRSNYTTIHTFLLGGIIIAAVILLPQGIGTYVREAITTRRFSLLDNVRRYRL
jgi:branched-chain amino acid transport system permease protein